MRQHIGDNPVLHGDLHCVVEAVEKPAERGAQGQFDNLLFGKMLFQIGEYLIAPEVTRRRLYLETMEEILPGVEKMVVAPNTVNMLPLLPLGNQAPSVGAAR